LEKLFDIIHEDEDLLVIHKPADLVCHPTKGDEFSSLISRARIYLKTDSEPRLVNRLDRETSGLVVIAKNAEAARELGKIWETRAVAKEYLAIVHGHVAAEQGIIDAPLGKDESSKVVIKDCVRSDGTPAQSDYYVVRTMTRSNSSVGGNNSSLSAACGGEGWGEVAPSSFTLLRIVPRTGRKHQIRIHLAHFGHPIVGDKLYGGDEDLYLALVERRLTNDQRVRLMLPTHALHAGRLKFHWRGREFDFSTPPEPAFLHFLNGE
jgi:23S rRNA pseudouridine1911/1915/1917 synthase